MGQQMASSMQGQRSENNDTGQLKDIVQQQAEQISEKNALLREFY